MSGLFITLEGLEGSGKTTQQKYIVDELRDKGFDVLLTREPGATRLGKRIRELLLDPEWSEMTPRAEILLFAADRAQHVEEVVKPALKAGKIVISDRYFDSNLAYQGYGRGLDIEIVKKINLWAVDYLKPDLTFFLDLPVEVGLARARAQTVDKLGDRLEREELKFYQQIRDGYLKLAEESERFRVIDANRSIKEVKVDILQVIEEMI
ncbi:dTMP kinase [Halanaerobiaceae bacterium Z-7014]|uniref:Thymidylate kinase n=1 Tax=Halonatronomonas betaini TaxID=2778430 RepID=A0A931AS26_9FIRM|nr:dTMP kinase [Halonatronomonas betaini]MBF8437973.1 dTMP kinase [Halonatronomonas betaini]